MSQLIKEGLTSSYTCCLRDRPSGGQRVGQGVRVLGVSGGVFTSGTGERESGMGCMFHHSGYSVWLVAALLPNPVFYKNN